MRGLTGLTLVFAGAAAAFYGYYPEADDRKNAVDRALASFSGDPPKSTARTAELPLVVVDPQRRAFSPQAPLFQQVPRGDVEPRTLPAPAATVASPSLAARVLPGSALAQSSQTSSGQSAPSQTAPSQAAASPVATVAELNAAPVIVPPSERPATAPRTPIATGKAGAEDAQRELARNLQKELKRVGCYDGEITGSWTAASRRAMKLFTDRVNATLPIDEPDYILLTLVQGHGGEACGARCPAEQVLAKDGKCQPRAIVAQAEKKAIKRSRPATATPDPAPVMTAERAPARSPEVGRAIEMWSKVSPDSTGSLGTKTAKTDGWKAAVIVAAPPPALAPATQPAPALAPLPGRMAIGGPDRTTAAAAGSPSAGSWSRTTTAAIAAPAPASVAAVEAPAATTTNPAAEQRRIPQHVVHSDRPRPQRRARSYDSGGSSYSQRAARPQKSSRVRAMHYNLFSRPDRVTN